MGAHREAAETKPHRRRVHLVGQALVRGACRRQVWQGPPRLCGGAHRGRVGDVVRVDAIINAAAACTHQNFFRCRLVKASMFSSSHGDKDTIVHLKANFLTPFIKARTVEEYSTESIG